MYKIAVIGDKISVSGFSVVGAEIHIVSSCFQAKEELKKMFTENYAIIFITEPLYRELDDVIAIYNKELVPAIVPIPGVNGNIDLGMNNIDDLLEKTSDSQFLS